ncbi:hypothetical protein BpHYR1_004493 [Brachionus plicatilis]|uniref:OTU domain-containing protein n=1 Tax=Brachionus plicatilis TaxID=10195 RepID=A0A3M7P7J7_BRAPC|nr:hypothetical protein BpHYR1_004493 [Brachionus plicatilis]
MNEFKNISLSNNPVENYFGVIKKRILEKKSLSQCGKVKEEPLPVKKNRENHSITIDRTDDALNLNEMKAMYDFITKENHNADILKHYLIEKKSLRSINGQTIETFQPYSQKIELFELRNFIPISARPDGNCFYRAISYCLFGSENFYYIFKIGSLFILIEYQNLFEDILQRHYYKEPFVEIFFKSARKNEWAMSINILAANGTILSFGLNNETLVPFPEIFNVSFRF